MENTTEYNTPTQNSPANGKKKIHPDLGGNLNLGSPEWQYLHEIG